MRLAGRARVVVVLVAVAVARPRRCRRRRRRRWRLRWRRRWRRRRRRRRRGRGRRRVGRRWRPGRRRRWRFRRNGSRLRRRRPEEAYAPRRRSRLHARNALRRVRGGYPRRTPGDHQLGDDLRVGGRLAEARCRALLRRQKANCRVDRGSGRDKECHRHPLAPTHAWMVALATSPELSEIRVGVSPGVVNFRAGPTGRTAKTRP